MKKRPKPLPVTRKTLRSYREKGLDITDARGNYDADKIAAAKLAQAEIGKGGTSQSVGAKYWDERYRAAKAQRAEQELEVATGKLVNQADVLAEWRGRVIQLRTLLTGAGRELAPRLVGKDAREIQALLDVRHFEILRTFAHQVYLPEVEKEPPTG